MNRRRLAMVAASATMALSITSVAAAGALAPSPTEPDAAAAALDSYKATTTPTTSQHAVAEQASVLERQQAAFVDAVNAQRQAQFYAQLAAQDELAAAQSAVQSGMWSCIRVAESGDNYSLTSGAYGILVSTWNAYSNLWGKFGSWSVPGEAPAAVQDYVAYKLYEVGGGFGGWNDHCTGR
jgi:hypothetical protein